MQKKVIYWLVLLIALSAVHAEEQPENYNEYQSLRLLFTLESGIQFVQTASNPKIEFFQADISFFPKDNSHLQVNSLNPQATPSAEIEQNKYVSFKWRNPAPADLEYKIIADVTTVNKLQLIKQKILFPIRNVDESLLEYTKPTTFIDITPEIEQKARAIIGGEDDLYVVVFNLAEWTKKNVEYNLSTLTAEVVQKSSWVLQNKKGVCDELTNLFISFLRSLGIPARFVSGMVYSNVDYKWGAHGWAEVYFPEVGWVPFDVTFGQYGWVDPSHIKLKESLDSGSPSAEYTWRASDVQVQMKELAVSAELKEKNGKQEPPVKITLQPAHNEVKFKSFVPLLVTIENTVESYISTSVTVRKAPGLTEKNVKEVLLKPGETKNVVWILEIPEGESTYLYTASLEAATSFGNSAISKIYYSDNFKFYDRDEAEQYLAKSVQREVKKPLEGVSMRCSADQEMYYANDTATISCILINARMQALNLEVCAQESCQQVAIDTQAEKRIAFTIQARNNGRIPVIAENEDAIVFTHVELATIPLPDIYMTDITPYVVDYKDNVLLKFNLNSDTEVHDVTIDFKFDRFQLDKFKGSREVTIEAPGRNLRNGLKFTVSFLDEKDKAYNLEKAVYLEVNNSPWYADLLDWFAEVFGVY
ncbi:MAG: transglutaminase domain-containing protein [Candidatus Woesearchaeota archaeon]|nr:transglutaminase domain-containing protein [Candidatus Woesearchaeota archaeon]